MLRVAFDGGVIDARTGGLGDRDVEVCLAGALVGLEVSAPPIVPEIACDLERGAPQPWRVTKSGGYKVLDVTATDVLDGGKPMALDSDEHDAQTTFLVIAPSTLPAIRIDKTTLLVLAGSATLVGIQIDNGAPLFAGMGLDGRLGHGGEDALTADAVMLAVDPSGSPVRACVDGKLVADASVDPKSVDDLVREARRILQDGHVLVDDRGRSVRLRAGSRDARRSRVSRRHAAVVDRRRRELRSSVTVRIGEHSRRTRRADRRQDPRDDQRA